MCYNTGSIFSQSEESVVLPPVELPSEFCHAPSSLLHLLDNLKNASGSFRIDNPVFELVVDSIKFSRFTTAMAKHVNHSLPCFMPTGGAVRLPDAIHVIFQVV